MSVKTEMMGTIKSYSIIKNDNNGMEKYGVIIDINQKLRQNSLDGFLHFSYGKSGK